MENKTAWLASTAIVVAGLFGSSAMADGTPQPRQKPTYLEEIDSLKERIEKLEKENEDSSIQTGARLKKIEDTQDAVQFSFTDGRPVIRSGDGRFEMALRGRVQLDWASFNQEASNFGAGYNCTVGTNSLCDLGSGTVFRRVRLGVEGKIFRDFIYELRLDFGGTDQEGAGIINIARVGYTGIPNVRIHAGAIQPIVTLYDATSSAELTTMERPQVITVLASNFGGDNGRVGVEATYQKENMFFSGDNLMVSAALTGDRVATNRTAGDRDENSQLLGRVAYRFYSDGESNAQLGFSGAQILSARGGAPGSARTLRLRERPEIRVTGERFIDTGDLSIDPDGGARAYGFELAGNYKNFYLAGEWYKFDVDRANSPVDPEFSGWYVEGEWIFTGENKRYVPAGTNNNVAVWRGPAVTSPWSPGGGLGAWSVHARYSTLDLNYNEGSAGAATPVGGVRGGEETNKIIGVTWYMNSNVKVMAEYNMVEVERLSPTGANLDADFDVIQGRLSFTF